MRRCAALAALFAALTMSGGAWATTINGHYMLNTWAGSDRCAAAAQKQFPDYTPESNAKRDNAMKQCLANGNLPPRNDLNH